MANDQQAITCAYGEAVFVANITRYMHCAECGSEQFVCSTHAPRLSRRIPCQQEGCLRMGTLRSYKAV